MISMMKSLLRWPPGAQKLSRALSNVFAPKIFDPTTGYDLCAEFYDDWKWQQVWAAVEWPRIEQMLISIINVTDSRPSVLDVGVGTGSYLRNVINKFDIAAGYGVDVSKGMIRCAEAKLQHTAEVKQGDARNLSYSNETFDVVLFCRVGSHIEDIALAAREIRRVLRCGGYLILSDLDSRFPYRFTRVPCGAQKLSIETHKHSISDWTRVIEDAGLRITKEVFIKTDDIFYADVPALSATKYRTKNTPVSFILSAQK
jgi:ubiquinone/menaquinone biosynthesis C-methylase UbiE